MTVEDDRIEQLKRKLYSREGFTPASHRFQMNPREENVVDGWGSETGLKINGVESAPQTHPLLKKFLGGALLFFLVSLGIAFYMFFMEGNQVSSANVDIQIVGPASIASGEPVDLGVSLINENRTALQDVVLTVEYPDGSRASAESTEPLKWTTENIETIGKGSVHTTTTKFVVFGDKDIPKTLNYKMEYTVAGSNARFTKEKKYDVMIGSSPLLVHVTAPQEVNSGQQFQMQVTVTSNSTSLLKGVIVAVEYPYGFSYSDSSLTPENDNRTWKIGDLKNGDKKVFTITGKVIAQDNEERTFRYMVGVEGEQGTLDTILGTAMPTISLRKPFFNTTFSIGGDSSDIVGANATGRVQAQLSLVNTLADSLSNVVVEVRMAGQVLNKFGVRVLDGGFYQSTQNVIVWDKNTNQNFTDLRPGEKIQTSFDLQDFNVPQNTKNPEITFDVTLKGVRSLVGGGVDNVTSTVTKKLRFFTNLKLIPRTFRSGVFTNTGPVPPRKEIASTYTVEWALSNTHNDVSGAQVKAVLPVYVDWMGAVSPNTESVVYDPDTRTVSWNAGTVPALAGFSTSAKKVQFQVRLNPSASQVGISPALTGQILVSGTDAFVNKRVDVTADPSTTDTSDGFSGIVQ